MCLCGWVFGRAAAAVSAAAAAAHRAHTSIHPSHRIAAPAARTRRTSLWPWPQSERQRQRARVYLAGRASASCNRLSRPRHVTVWCYAAIVQSIDRLDRLTDRAPADSRNPRPVPYLSNFHHSLYGLSFTFGLLARSLAFVAAFPASLSASALQPASCFFKKQQLLRYFVRCLDPLLHHLNLTSGDRPALVSILGSLAPLAHCPASLTPTAPDLSTTAVPRHILIPTHLFSPTLDPLPSFTFLCSRPPST